MDTRNETHLTDAQFTDLLLGAIPPSVTAHLDACPQCAEEAQRVSGAIGSFDRQSRLWAERRAAAHPMPAPSRQPALSWLNRPAAWSAAAAALVLATVLGVAHRNEHVVPTQQQVAAVQPAPEVSPATLKADNDLLSAINGELSADATPPASLYGLKVNTHTTRARSFKGMSN